MDNPIHIANVVPGRKNHINVRSQLSEKGNLLKPSCFALLLSVLRSLRKPEYRKVEIKKMYSLSKIKHVFCIDQMNGCFALTNQSIAADGNGCGESVSWGMSTEEFRIKGREMVDYIAEYLENIGQRRVTPKCEPGYLKGNGLLDLSSRYLSLETLALEFRKSSLFRVRWMHSLIIRDYYYVSSFLENFYCQSYSKSKWSGSL